MFSAARACRRAAIAFALLAVAWPPSLARAQPDAALQAIRELAVLASQHEGERSVGVVADHLAAAVREWDRAIRTLQDRLEGVQSGAPNAYQMHLELALAYRSRGRWADAVREFDAAAAVRPGGSDLQLLRALTLEAAGKPHAAAKGLHLAWRLDARNPVKAYYVLQHGAPDAADRAAGDALLSDAYMRLVRGESLGISAPFLSVGVLPDTLSRVPVVADEALTDAFALLNAYRFGEAAAALKRAPAPAGAGRPDLVRSGGERAPLTHFVRGKSAEEENRVADARREYEAALGGTLVGRHVLHVALGRLALVDGDTPAAIDAFASAAALAPNDAAIHRELADAFAAHGQDDEAFRELVAALLVDPRDAQAYAAIGQLRLDTGADEDAVLAFSRALDLMPDRFEPRWGLATALTRLGRSDEAARQLEQFERARRAADERRRHEMATEVEQQESIRRRALDK